MHVELARAQRCGDLQADEVGTDHDRAFRGLRAGDQRVAEFVTTIKTNEIPLGGLVAIGAAAQDHDVAFEHTCAGDHREEAGPRAWLFRSSSTRGE